MRRRHRPIRPPQTGLPDRVVLEIVTRVIAERGHLDAELAALWMLAERQARGRLLWFPLRAARELAPTGTAG
jgi:hypothetical protein